MHIRPREADILCRCNRNHSSKDESCGLKQGNLHSKRKCIMIKEMNGTHKSRQAQPYSNTASWKLSTLRIKVLVGTTLT